MRGTCYPDKYLNENKAIVKQLLNNNHQYNILMKSSIYVQYFSQYKSKKEKFRQPWQKYFRNTHDKYAIQALNSQVANKSEIGFITFKF